VIGDRKCRTALAKITEKSFKSDFETHNFRGKFLELLKKWYRAGDLHFKKADYCDVWYFKKRSQEKLALGFILSMGGKSDGYL